MTPLLSSWLTSLVTNGEEVILATTNGKRLRYTGVPQHIVQALQVAGSPGRIWRELLRGRYNESVIR
jgi:hypothetical protein